MGIFNRFLKHIVGKPQQAMQAEEKQRLLNTFNHYTPLLHLQENRRLIEVLIPTQLESFQTMILDIDLYHQKLTIDNLAPALKDPSSLVGMEIMLRHQQGQTMLTMTSRVTEFCSGDQSLVLELADNLAYLPRRSAPRYEPEANVNAKSTLYPVYGAPWYSTIKNISMGGMRVAIAGDVRANLRKHLFLKRCDINFNGDITRFSGRVKSYTYISRPFRHTLVSVAFEGLSVEQMENLDDLIDEAIPEASY